jgi:mono/diheme cytochrome c family protein
MARLLLAALWFASVPALAGDLADAHADYLLYCRGCHLHTGDAVPAANVPSLQALAPLLESAAGREYIVRVPGVAQTPMSDEQLAAVLNWVAVNFNGDTLPEDFEPYTAREVGIARTKVLTDPLKTRQEILEGS